MQFQERMTVSAPGERRQRQPRDDWHGRIGAAFVSDRSRFGAFVIFVLLVAFTGGSSRSDVQGMIFLRPAAVLFSAYALALVSSQQLREVKVPLTIVTALLVLALLQLAPLPAEIWTALPHRDVVREASSLLGMGNLPRSLSLDPGRTWNTFFALFVPLAAICLSAIQAPEYRRLLVPLLMAVALLSAVLGFLQAIGGDGLQPYRITHRGYPVGLFANKNHQSVMLLWLMLAAGWLAAKADPRRHSARVAIGGGLSLILVLFPLLILTGSRAGMLLSIPTLALSGWLLLRSAAMKQVLHQSGRRAKLIIGCVTAMIVAPLLLVVAVLAASGRHTALSRLFELEAAEDLRSSYLPIFVEMARDFLPFGSGFGSFESVFKMYEPASMLTSRYMNQAHNDPLQILIEGGLPALVIVVAGLAWLARSGWLLWRLPGRDGRPLAVFFCGSVALWLAASAVDYPLRTPLAAMLVATLTALLSLLSTGHRSSLALSGGREGQGEA